MRYRRILEAHQEPSRNVWSTNCGDPAVNIFKWRFAFTINGCIAEFSEILVNGASIKSVNVESVDIDAILQAMDMLSLNGYENVNYLLAIKRVIGMEPRPN